MSKFLRELCRWAEDAGLTYVGVEHHVVHDVAFFDNAAGMRLARTFSKGSGTSNGNRRDELNSKAELRRFARCQYHGLRVTGTRKQA